jgi:hypothetical protein
MNKEYLEEYKKRFHVFLTSMYRQQSMIGVISGELMMSIDTWDELSRWPEKNWPGMDNVEKFLQEEIRTTQKNLGYAYLPWRVNSYCQHFAQEWVMGYLGETLPPDDWSRVYREDMIGQSLVMMVAALEAFLIDSVKTICLVQPRVMKNNNKEIKWEDIIDAGSYDELMEILADLYAKDINKNIKGGIRFMEKNLGLVINFPETGLKKLDDARNVRNLIVHTGGRIDKKFLKNVGWKGAVVGERIKLEIEWIGEVWESTCGVCTSVYFGTIKKFFKANPEDMVYWNNSGHLF